MSSDQAPAAEGTVPAPADEKRRPGWVTFLRDVLIIVIVALLVSFLVKTFLVRSFYIPSASMTDTLLVDDRILVDEITPRFGGYDRGDVVVFRDPGGWLPVQTTPERSPFVEGIDWVLALVGLSAPDSDEHLIKRIIGLPGDRVVCCNDLGQVTVNGDAIDETPYLNLPAGKTAPTEMAFDVTVPDDSLWVMGDNRDNSQDSRYHQDQPGGGFVPRDNVVGRAFLITWPFDRFGTIDFRHSVFAGVPEPEAAP